MFNRIKDWLLQIYWNAKIRNRIAFFNTLLLGCLAIIMLLSNNILARKLVVHYASDNARQSNQIVREKIEYLLTNSEDMAALIENNDIVQKKLIVKTQREKMDRIYPISNILNRAVQNSTGINTIILYPKDWSEPITSTRVNLDKLSSEFRQGMQAEVEDVWDKSLWSDIHQSEYQIFQDERTTITLKRNIISIYTGGIVGFLAIDITEERIAETYAGSADSSNIVLIVNQQGRVVSASDKHFLNERICDMLDISEDDLADQELNSFQTDATNHAKICKSEGREYLVDTTKIEKMGWWILRLIPLQDVYAQTRQTTVIACLVALIVAFLAALCVRRIAISLTQPLTRLSQIMEEEPLKDNNVLLVPGNDEVAILNRSFQRMRLNMQILIERIKHEQQQQMQINMSSLQTQINPHFLYNTLDSVCALLQLKRIDDASHMLKSIELFYRGTLSKGKTIISIRDEIYVTKQFVDIQRYRYEGELCVHIQISEEILDCCIPKLTLQPIVENAIYHGLKNGGRDGIIEIFEEHNAEKIRISIRDNGVGFFPDPFEVPHDNIKSSGFGLYNTQRRIKYYFGNDYGLQIESKIGVGTTVYLIIPNQKIHRKEGFSLD